MLKKEDNQMEKEDLAFACIKILICFIYFE